MNILCFGTSVEILYNPLEKCCYTLLKNLKHTSFQFKCMVMINKIGKFPKFLVFSPNFPNYNDPRPIS